MSDNSYELYCPPFLNHPRTCPKNMNPYRPKVLSTNQQTKTDHAKIKMAKHNEQYLGAHPEIKAIVSLILRSLFIHRPLNIQDFVGEFVKRREFPDEIAKYLVERLHFPVPEDEEDDVETKSKSSPSPEDDRFFETPMSTQGMSVKGDHKFLKKMLYGVESTSLRRSAQSETSRPHLGISYDQLLKMIRSSTSNAIPEEVGAVPSNSVITEEEEEEEEEQPSENSSEFGSADNEEALLEGQRLIFAMLGRQISSTSFMESMRMGGDRGSVKTRERHAAFDEEEERRRSSVQTHSTRGSMFDGSEMSSTDNRVEDEQEEEEFFEKD